MKVIFKIMPSSLGEIWKIQVTVFHNVDRSCFGLQTAYIHTFRVNLLYCSFEIAI